MKGPNKQIQLKSSSGHAENLFSFLVVYNTFHSWVFLDLNYLFCPQKEGFKGICVLQKKYYNLHKLLILDILISSLMTEQQYHSFSVW